MAHYGIQLRKHVVTANLRNLLIIKQIDVNASTIKKTIKEDVKLVKQECYGIL